MRISARSIATLSVVVLVVFAGCLGGGSSGPSGADGSGTDGAADGGAGDGSGNGSEDGGAGDGSSGDGSQDGATGDGSSGDGGSGDGTATPSDRGGMVNFYVSDRPEAIDDFRHLNVTVSRVGFERSGGGWVERSANDTTVDLTRLVGANATLINSYDVPNGSYGKVFLYASDVEGVLKTGETVRVKLPSEKLQVKKGFTVGPNTSVDFVFDIAVHKAGKSGKYILRPVVSESGTDVEKKPVDGPRGPGNDRGKGNDKGDGKDGKDRGNDRGDGKDERKGDGKDERKGDGKDQRKGGGNAGSLNASFVGDVAPGENATVRVTAGGDPVADAAVFVDDRRVGTTDEQGRIQVSVPADAGKFKLKVRAKGAEAELEVEFDE